MYSRSKIFLFCIFTILSKANGDDSVTRTIFPGGATDEIVQSLLEVTPKQALPVVLFEVKKMIFPPLGRKRKGSSALKRKRKALSRNEPELEPLVGITLAKVKDGRLVFGTKFYSELPGKQIFFCPTSHAETTEQCLAPMKFEESQILECDHEPIPIAFASKKSCGSSGTGTFLGFSYEICPAEQQYHYKSAYYDIYALCYDESSRKTISASYYLVGAALLEDKLLIREREITFEINKETYGLIDADYYTNLEVEIQQKPKYTLQKLVPTEDMPLAALRKTTQYFANFALQHVALINLWNEIGRYFRDHALQWITENRSANLIARFGRDTGVIDIPKNKINILVGGNQKANIWITVFGEYSVRCQEKRLAVLLNNFITNDLNDQDVYTKTSKKQFIDMLCDENFCADSLKEKFKKVGVQGRCCQVTKLIHQLFYKSRSFRETEILHVKNITD